MLSPWEILSSKTVLADRWIHLRADTCRRADGHLIDPYYVLEERDYVHAIPVLPDGRIVLVRQYRHGAGQFCLELPGGVLDAGETPLAGAKRELREECGAASTAWQPEPIARFFPNPARQTNRFHCFLAHDVQLDAATDWDPAEELEIHFLSVSEIDAAITSGEFSLSSHIAAFLMARSTLVGS